MVGCVELKYNDGRLAGIIMHSPMTVNVQDLRKGEPPFFVSIDADDGDVSSKFFLEPEVAESLTKQLVSLFPQEPAKVPDDPPFVLASGAGGSLAGVSPPAGEVGRGARRPQEPAEFDALAACEKIRECLGKAGLLQGCDNPDLILAIAVLKRALRLTKQDEEHNTLTAAGI